MKSKKVFVSPSGDKWKVQSVGARKVAGLFDKKSEARVHASGVAKIFMAASLYKNLYTSHIVNIGKTRVFSAKAL